MIITLLDTWEDEFVSVPEKTCTCCKRNLPLSLFNKHKCCPDGLDYECKSCANKKKVERVMRRVGILPPRTLPDRPTIKECRKCHRTLAVNNINFSCETIKNRLYSGDCRDCLRAHAREVQAKRRADPEESLKLKASIEKYYKSEKGILCKRKSAKIYNHRRRQRHMNTQWLWSDKLWLRCKEEWENKCVYCDKLDDLTQDHFIPLSNQYCPGTVPWNMVPACLSCNTRKQRHHPDDWMTDRRRFESIRSKLVRIRDDYDGSIWVDPMRNGIGGHTKPYEGDEDEWLTPPHVIKALGVFDLDPCSPIIRPWDTAKKHYTTLDDGLKMPWNSDRIWLNCPYGPHTKTWLAKLADHGDGIALVFGRTDTEFFHRTIFERADAILFLEGRLHFHYVDGTRAKHNSGGPSVLVAYDDQSWSHKSNTDYLRDSGLPGKLVVLK